MALVYLLCFSAFLKGNIEISMLWIAWCGFSFGITLETSQGGGVVKQWYCKYCCILSQTKSTNHSTLKYVSSLYHM